MADNWVDSKEAENLRRLAEERMTESSPDLQALPRASLEHLLHELQVYQVELEMQNEELRRVQEELQDTLARYADLYDFAPMGYFVLDPDGKISTVNLAGAQLLAVERSRLQGRPFSHYIYPQDQDIFYFHRREVTESGAGKSCELRLKRADGGLTPVCLDSLLVPDRVAGQPGHMRIAATDISERRQVEETLAAGARISSQLATILDLDELLEIAVRLIQQTFQYDYAGLYLLDAADETLACRAASGCLDQQRAGRLLPDQGLAWTAVRREETVVANDLNERPEYTLGGCPAARSALAAPLRAKGKVSGVLLLACRQPGAFADRDVLAISALSDHLATAVDNARLVTRLKETQDQLVRKERLAALGQMAATVAHELRNPLMGVRMGVDYFARELSPGERHQRAANLLKNNVDRIDRIVEEVLFLGRESQFNVQPGRLKAIIEQELDRWAPELADKNIRVSSHLASLPPVLVDPDQIGRAVSNLIGNSIDVLPSGGVLKLDLHAAGQDQVFILSDNGPGISPEQLARIFEPFFTTKARGTGLGLAIVEHIIKQHGGQVAVSSEVGAGTRFIITLPV